MRAKSIKNKARVNVEMSPAELKALLKKTVAELAAVREHAASLEEEVKSWRNGVKVEKEAWAPAMAEALKSSGATAAATAAAPSKVTSPLPATPGSSGTTSRAGTPGLLPAFNESRPDTPTVYNMTLEKDEREDFLKRENELSDQLAEKVEEPGPLVWSGNLADGCRNLHYRHKRRSWWILRMKWRISKSKRLQCRRSVGILHLGIGAWTDG